MLDESGKFALGCLTVLAYGLKADASKSRTLSSTWLAVDGVTTLMNLWIAKNLLASARADDKAVGIVLVLTSIAIIVGHVKKTKGTDAVWNYADGGNVALWMVLILAQPDVCNKMFSKCE